MHSNKSFLSQVGNINHAMRLISAESKYSKIVFGDDWIFPECIKQMVEVAEANPSAGIVGAYRLNGVEVDCERRFIAGNSFFRSSVLSRIYKFALE